MASKQASLPELETLLTCLAMGESPGWHEDRLWFSDWGAQEIWRARSSIWATRTQNNPFDFGSDKCRSTSRKNKKNLGESDS